MKQKKLFLFFLFLHKTKLYDFFRYSLNNQNTIKCFAGRNNHKRLFRCISKTDFFPKIKCLKKKKKY
jgi:hypothetical protein